MEEGNGKAIEIARLDERIKSLRFDFEKNKEDEKDYGKKVDKTLDTINDKLDKLKTSQTKQWAIMTTVYALAAAALKYLL